MLYIKDKDEKQGKSIQAAPKKPKESSSQVTVVKEENTSVSAILNRIKREEKEEEKQEIESNVTRTPNKSVKDRWNANGKNNNNSKVITANKTSIKNRWNPNPDSANKFSKPLPRRATRPKTKRKSNSFGLPKEEKKLVVRNGGRMSPSNPVQNESKKEPSKTVNNIPEKKVINNEKAQTQTQTKAQPKVQPQTQPKIQPQTQPTIQPEAQPKVQPQIQPKTQAQKRPQTRPKIQPQAPTKIQKRNEQTEAPAQPPPAVNLNCDMNHNVITWDNWLKQQQIADSLITKLRDAGIANWDELHAIEDDVDDVAKELGATAIQKIKLKAVLRKLPPLNDLPTIQAEIAKKSTPKAKPQPQPQPVEVKEVKEVEPEPVVPEPEPDLDDPLYLKTQILFLKAENLRLNKLADENGSKQQVMESWDNLFTKDMEIKELQKQLDDECKKSEQNKMQCMKLEKLLQLKENQNYMDIQEKLYQNYCLSINTFINKIESSTSTLDNTAVTAINEMKQLMIKNSDILDKELNTKKTQLNDNRKHVKELKQIKLIDTDTEIIDVLHDVLLRIDNVEQLTKKRTAINIMLTTKINTLLNSINSEKCVILTKIGELCVDKYNQLFYKYFIEQMTMNFYDCKLIKSQFIQNNKPILLDNKNGNSSGDSVLCKDGEKIIFDIPLTYNLLSMVRNEQSEMSLFYDVLCLDKFIKNVILFEQNIIYNDPLTFASVIGIHLTNSNIVQNIIKATQNVALYENGSMDEKISKNLKETAKIFVDNLTCLIVTGYAMLIINACNDKMDYIQCLTDLCLSHPNKSDVMNKEKLKKILNNIQTNQLKELINDYFINFGTVEFLEKIINNARAAQ